MIPSKLFQFFNHIGCAFNLHSIINSGLILGGQNSSNRQCSFCLWILWTKSQRTLGDWLECTTSCTIPAQCMEETSRRSIGSTSILLLRNDWNSFRLDRMLSSFKKQTLPVYCNPKVVAMKTGEVLYEKKYTCHLDLRQRSHWNMNGKEN